MLRIAITTTTGQAGVTLHLEGALIGAWVDELDQVCAPVLADAAALQLDLAGVSFVSREGAQLLGSLRGRGVALLNCSGLVVEQLKAQAEAEHTA